MSWDIEWCEICDGHHGPGQHPTPAESAIATRNAELHTELARVRAELAEANNRWHSACDVGRRLEVRNAQLLGELAEATAAADERHAKLVAVADKLAAEREALAEATAREVSLAEAANQLSRELAEVRTKLEKFTEWCSSARPRRLTPAESEVLDAVDRTCEGRNGLPTDQPAWRLVAEAWREKQLARRKEAP